MPNMKKNGLRDEHVRRFEEALSSNNSYAELHRLAVSLRDEGVNQIEVYRLFSRFQVATSGDNPNYDAIVDTMDLICGGPWAKGGDIFPRPLTDDEIDKSRNAQ
jgi:hypothetical protein